MRGWAPTYRRQKILEMVKFIDNLWKNWWNRMRCGVTDGCAMLVVLVVSKVLLENGHVRTQKVLWGVAEQEASSQLLQGNSRCRNQRKSWCITFISLAALLPMRLSLLHLEGEWRQLHLWLIYRWCSLCPAWQPLVCSLSLVLKWHCPFSTMAGVVWGTIDVVL